MGGLVDKDRLQLRASITWMLLLTTQRSLNCDVRDGLCCSELPEPVTVVVVLVAP